MHDFFVRGQQIWSTLLYIRTERQCVKWKKQITHAQILMGQSFHNLIVREQHWGDCPPQNKNYNTWCVRDVGENMRRINKLPLPLVANQTRCDCAEDASPPAKWDFEWSEALGPHSRHSRTDPWRSSRPCSRSRRTASSAGRRPGKCCTPTWRRQTGLRMRDGILIGFTPVRAMFAHLGLIQSENIGFNLLMSKHIKCFLGFPMKLRIKFFVQC